MPRLRLPTALLTLRTAWLALCLASATACGAATGLDVGAVGQEAGANDDASTPAGDASATTCSPCPLPNVCVSRSTAPTHSVSVGSACVPIPAACDGVVTCACAEELCGDQQCFDARTTPFRALLTCYAP